MSDDKKKTATRRTPRKPAKAAKKAAAPPKPPAKRPAAPRSGDKVRETPAPQNPSPAPKLAAIPLHVRWRDLDAFNHVNNSSYLTYLEEARLQWLRTVPGQWFSEHAMPVMAAVELHYRRPIEWPAEIDVLLSCERLGNSSMTVGNRIVDRHDASIVYADGNVVMVWIDPATGASVSLPQAIRDAVG